jgi:hypothetical protein
MTFGNKIRAQLVFKFGRYDVMVTVVGVADIAERKFKN